MSFGLNEHRSPHNVGFGYALNGTAKEDGSFDFAAENEPKAAAELEELLEMEVTPEVEAIDIPITENLLLSANDIGLLMPFVHFTEE